MSRSVRYAEIFGLQPRDFWRTPPDELARIAEEFGPIGLDCCALPDDSVAPAHIGPDEDCRRVEWGPRFQGVVAFLNPPYSRKSGGILSFVERAAEQAQRWHLVVIVLAPPGVGTRYRARARELGAEIRDLPGRLSFLHPDTGLPVAGNREGSTLFIFRGTDV